MLPSENGTSHRVSDLDMLIARISALELKHSLSKERDLQMAALEAEMHLSYITLMIMQRNFRSNIIVNSKLNENE